MMTRPVVLIAASGLAREVADTLSLSAEHRITSVLDDNSALHGTELAPGVPVVGGIDLAAQLCDVQFVICAGSGTARRSIADRMLGWGIGSERFATVVHPTVAVSSSCSVGAGSVVLAHVAMTADVTVGEHVVLMPQVVLTHDDAVDDFATLCAGVILGGTVAVESGAYLGMNSSVRQGLRVGRDATLGMGSVLLQDLPAKQTWAGIPAVLLPERHDAGLGNVHDIHGRKPDVVATERLDAR